MAFSIAGSMAFKDAMRKADPIITEPIMKVAVIVPDEYLGDVIGDLNARRGQIQGMEAMAGTQRVNAFVPLAQMFGYATDQDPGPWPVCHGAFSLRAGSQEHCRPDHCWPHQGLIA